MTTHLFLPSLSINRLELLPEHGAWLAEWLQSLEADIEAAEVAVSQCLQGVISELALHKQVKTDWLGIMDEYLMRDGRPVAYSEQYGKRLYGFAPWIQTEVHAIHARWWIEQTLGLPPSLEYQTLVEELIQPSGWIYNPTVSPTGLRTRMKSEYLMHLAMGIEILAAFGALAARKGTFEGALSPLAVTGYLGAEHFRLHALRTLNSAQLSPTGLDAVLTSCEVGEGYCDFDVKAKVDDYMGTAKRVAKDIPVHSALSGLHALSVSLACSDVVKNHVKARMQSFGAHLKAHPLDIQPFRMRDIDIPFGTGLSPLEVVAAGSTASF